MNLVTGIFAPLLATAVAVSSAAVGLWLSGAPGGARPIIPFSGGLLVGVALFGLLPEAGASTGWPASSLLFLMGYLLLLSVDRFVAPVCPSCSRGHDHASCSAVLHGFAPPMIAATAFHAFLDGWGIAAAQTSATPGIRLALPLAVILHKIPEGIALGAILRAAVASRISALGWCVAVESATLAGGLVGLAAAPTAWWLRGTLAVAAGCFFYLGFHAVHEEWRRRGGWVFVSALTGAAGAAAVQQGVRVFLR
ncbi:MAG: ZIP family metal transporter [Acidobacteria bacterium]|nr:ZIP family metal transporter [Acidobacteriota bacterium]MBI3472171.1 ZIP family metal transporter [Candidatus Solibacter usitatus]